MVISLLALRHCPKHHSRHASFVTSAPHRPTQRSGNDRGSGKVPEDAALDSDQNRLLQQLLHGLPDEQRQLIELRAAGLTAAEIGVVLGKSETAVRQAQSRLIRSLRAQFDVSADGVMRHA
ncbi:MAG: sigma-70 family RNA polymerase sigma factor [Thermomicrobiales bacterium]